VVEPVHHGGLVAQAEVQGDQVARSGTAGFGRCPLDPVGPQPGGVLSRRSRGCRPPPAGAPAARWRCRPTRSRCAARSGCPPRWRTSRRPTRRPPRARLRRTVAAGGDRALGPSERGGGRRLSPSTVATGTPRSMAAACTARTSGASATLASAWTATLCSTSRSPVCGCRPVISAGPRRTGSPPAPRPASARPRAVPARSSAVPARRRWRGRRPGARLGRRSRAPSPSRYSIWSGAEPIGVTYATPGRRWGRCRCPSSPP
jgi:hypothetical protein